MGHNIRVPILSNVATVVTRMVILQVACIVSCSAMLTAPEQEDTNCVNVHRLVAVSTATAGTLVGVHVYQRNAWWQGPRAPFRFENDWQYALNIDKLGHMYGAYLESKVCGNIVRWIGYDSATSTFYGSLFGLAFQLYVEIEDGYHKDYGFSPGDAFADIMGAALPLLQATVPEMSNINLKFSYWPSTQYLDEVRQGKSRAFLDDYQGQTFWVGVDPHFLMGENMRTVIPAWLGLSMGAAVRDLDGQGNGTRHFYLTLDYNLSNIRPESGFLRTLFAALDYIHFPAPGLALEGGRLRAGIFY